jgi:hypothetical protein
MPSTPGTYPVYFKVTSGGVIIGTFVATEDVIIKEAAWVSPGSDNAPSGWGSPELSRDGDKATDAETGAWTGPPYTYTCTPLELYTPSKICGAIKILARTTLLQTTLTIEVRKDGVWQVVGSMVPDELYSYPPLWKIISFSAGMVDAIRLTPYQPPSTFGDRLFVYEVLFLDGVTVPDIWYAVPPIKIYLRRPEDNGAIIPTWSAFMRMDVDIKNFSTQDRSLSLSVFLRQKGSHTGYAWSNWYALPTYSFDTQKERDAYNSQMKLSAFVPAGQVVTFMCVFYGGIEAITGMPTMQLKITGEFGEVYSPEFKMVETA